MAHAVWIFGYGSLIWRPDFEFAERAPAHVLGVRRAFAQASTDHRGTPTEPGRVVTLVASPGARCVGMAYRIDACVRAAMLDRLDKRESGGYERHQLTLHFHDARPTCDALVYVAGAGNPNHVGEAPLAEVAKIVRKARGPSGANREYVERLATALLDLGVREDPAISLARLL